MGGQEVAAAMVTRTPRVISTEVVARGDSSRASRVATRFGTRVLWHSRYMSASSSGDPLGLPAATCKTPAPVSARPPANTASSRVVGDATSRPDSAASVLMSLAGQVDGRPISMIESDAEIDGDASDASSFGCDGSPAHPLRPLHPGFNVSASGCRDKSATSTALAPSRPQTSSRRSIASKTPTTCTRSLLSRFRTRSPRRFQL